MNCNIIKDLIPLYVDGCCSEESKKIVNEHIQSCNACKKLLEDMNAPSDIVVVSKEPITFHKLNNWKASVLQSVLLFVSFALITIGVALTQSATLLRAISWGEPWQLWHLAPIVLYNILFLLVAIHRIDRMKNI